MHEIGMMVLVGLAVLALAFDAWHSRRQVDRVMELLSARTIGEWASAKIGLSREERKANGAGRLSRDEQAALNEKKKVEEAIARAEADPYSQG